MAEEQLKYADFEELVFENRNKAYGAYDLRRSYRGLPYWCIVFFRHDSFAIVIL